MGLYVQQQFSWKDRLYLTGAVRADDQAGSQRPLAAIEAVPVGVNPATQERSAPQSEIRIDAVTISESGG